MVEIYSGLSKGENVRDIQKNLQKITFNQKKQGLAYDTKMLELAQKSVSVLKKKIGSSNSQKNFVEMTFGLKIKEEQVILSIFVYELLKKNDIEEKCSKIITKTCNDYEANLKEKVFDDVFEENRNYDTPIVFYLASQHKDSASDHAPYQGKMYIDEKWINFIHDAETIKEIKDYIREHNVKTIQWVMGKPVWFITRPNCRHYFTPIDTKSVLKKSAKRLLRKNKMNSAIGNREYLQTIQKSDTKKQYTRERNAQIMLEKYQERLELHQNMYQKAKNKILEKAITKDKMLINKWKDYLK